MFALEVKDVCHAFGTHKVLHNINFQIKAGQIVALVGPSGCGKSTLLRAILGTHPPNRGTILTGGRPVLTPTRDIGIVYQHYSLFDFLTARQNVAMGLMLDQTKIPFRLFRPVAWRRLRKQHLAQAQAFLQRMKLAQAADRFPHEMSGGMRQRVAIAQALIMRPRILLLDEPFGALDEATREDLQVMLLGLYAENIEAAQRGEIPDFTILMVTHELNEAIYVSERILGLSQYHQDGHQGATVVYDKPAPIFNPTDVRDFSKFLAQKDELRNIVFDPDSRQHWSEYVTFWSELQPPQTASDRL